MTHARSHSECKQYARASANATKPKLIMAHSLNRNNLTAASMLSAPANDAERQTNKPPQYNRVKDRQTDRQTREVECMRERSSVTATATTFCGVA